ncbi:MAG: hypothetical protein ACHQAZ_00905 [Gammaproteobacteria bacterium]
MKTLQPHLITRLFAFCGLVLLLVGCVSRDVNQYVGKDPHIVFPAAQLVDQSLIQVDSAHPNADWGFSLVWEGDHYLLTADQNITPGGTTQSWRVQAVQRIPLLLYDQMLVMGICKQGGGLMSRVVAVVNYDHTKEWFDNIQAAWAYDAAHNTFVEYPTQGMRCLNRLYGTDLTPPAPVFLAPVSTTVPAAVTAQPPAAAKPPSP